MILCNCLFQGFRKSDMLTYNVPSKRWLLQPNRLLFSWDSQDLETIWDLDWASESFCHYAEKMSGPLTQKSRWCGQTAVPQPFSSISLCDPMPRHPPTLCPTFQMSSEVFLPLPFSPTSFYLLGRAKGEQWIPELPESNFHTRIETNKQTQNLRHKLFNFCSSFCFALFETE